MSDTAGETYAFTGDNIFIQSFGRPDLGGQGEAWVPIVYETIYHKFKNAVADDTLVLPGHYATFAEADSSGLVARRAVDLWRENAGLQFDAPVSLYCVCTESPTPAARTVRGDKTSQHRSDPTGRKYRQRT
jgi:glyoxylase-like metal-dependent hydrolase (beta-lactamase superfamily II)